MSSYNVTAIVNDSMITMDTKEIELDYGEGRPTIITTNYSINFTYSYGDKEKFFDISVSNCSVVCVLISWPVAYG